MPLSERSRSTQVCTPSVPTERVVARRGAPVWRRQIEEAGGFPIAWDDIEAREAGTVGWASARMTFQGPEVPVDVRCVSSRVGVRVVPDALRDAVCEHKRGVRRCVE
jgi:hypothetical protein